MRRAALGVALASLALPAAVAADSFTPIRLTVRIPAIVRADRAFVAGLQVSADPGGLDAHRGIVRAQVRLTSGECGGVFAGTSGPIVLDRPLSPQPSPGRAYTGGARGPAHVRSYGTYTVCAYLDDDMQELATVTGEETVTVSRACTRAAQAYDRHRRRAALRRAARRACGSGVTL